MTWGAGARQYPLGLSVQMRSIASHETSGEVGVGRGRLGAGIPWDGASVGRNHKCPCTGEWKGLVNGSKG